MSYLHCRRCGLQIRIQATFMRVENCPRCLARTATMSPLLERTEWVRPPVARWRAQSGEPADEPRAHGA